MILLEEDPRGTTVGFSLCGRILPPMESFLFAIVDDDPDNRAILKEMLGSSGHVDMYEDAASALAGMKVREPQLAMIDMSLPDEDGIALLRKMRDDPGLARIPAIVVTAHAMTGDRERFLAAGFQGYLSKPFDEAGLLGMIRTLLPGIGFGG